MKISNLLRSIAVVSCLNFLLASNILAEKPEFINLSTGEWPPYISQHEENLGTLSKIVKDAFESQGIKVTTDFYPWKRSDSELTNLKLLGKGRLDVIAGYELTISYFLRERGLSDIIKKTGFSALSGRENYLVLAKYSPHSDRKEEFSQIMNTIVDSGESESIIDDFITSVTFDSLTEKPPISQ